MILVKAGLLFWDLRRRLIFSSGSTKGSMEKDIPKLVSTYQ
jgi:hypothetical protein